MARKRFGEITLDEIIRDAFDAGFRSLNGDPVRPEPPSPTREMTAAEAARDLGELATTLS